MLKSLHFKNLKKNTVTTQVFLGTIFWKTKKGISPVVATALLLVVAVMSVVGFSGWFSTFSSSVFTDIESKTGTSSKVAFEGLVGEKLYIRSGGNSSINSVSVSGIDCNYNGSISGLGFIDISSCIENVSGVADIVVVTGDRVLESYFYVSNSLNNNSEIVVSNLDCSTIDGGDWALVPGDSILGTNDFCVMRFEAKFQDYSGKTNFFGWNLWQYDSAPGNLNITSSSLGGPVGIINQTDAIKSCQNLGENYDLISNIEWMTIARNAELQSENWDSGTIYSGSMFKGHTDNSANALSVTDVNDFYDGTGNVFPSNQKRVINLSNGELIWDFGGNVFEWNKDVIDCSSGYPCLDLPTNGSSISELVKFPDLTNYGSLSKLLLEPINKSLDSINGVGYIYNGVNTAGPSGDLHAFVRSGNWDNSINGIYALALDSTPSGPGFFGFRCVYNP